MKILDFYPYISEKTKDFTGREWVFREIENWLTNLDAPRYFIITGEPGIGKSAIAARFTQIRDLDAIHFCIARHGDTIDPLIFTRSISHQLTYIDGFAKGILKESGIEIKLKIDVQKNYGKFIGIQIENLIGKNSGSAIMAFNRAVVVPIKKLYEEEFSRQIVILVDALDESVLYQGENIVDLIVNTQGLPTQVRFILTSRPQSFVLRYFEQQHIPHLVLNADREENIKDIREYICYRLEASKDLQARLMKQQMRSQTFIDLITEVSQGNFLYLVWLLPAIENGAQQFDKLEVLPKGLDDIYRDFLRNRTVGKDILRWRICYRPILGILVVMQAPLGEKQLENFTGICKQDLADYLFDLEQFLDPVLVKQKQYRLYHQSVTDFLCDKERAGEFWIDTVSVHRHIVSYYQSKSPTWNELDWNHIDDYGLHYLSAHLYELRSIGNYRAELYKLICQSFMRAKHTLYGTHEYFKKDIALAIEAAGSEKPPNLVQEIRGFIINTTLRSLATNMPIQVLETLTRLDQDSRAQNFASIIINKDLQAQAYCMIGEALLYQKDKAKSAFIQALVAAEMIVDTSIKLEELRKIAKAMAVLGEKTKSSEIINRILEDIKMIKDKNIKVRELREIAGTLAQIGEKSRAFEITNQAKIYAENIEDKCSKVIALAEIAETMVQIGEKIIAIGILNMVQTDVEKIKDWYCKTKALIKVANIMAKIGEKMVALEIINSARSYTENIQLEYNTAEGIEWFEPTNWFVSGG